MERSGLSLPLITALSFLLLNISSPALGAQMLNSAGRGRAVAPAVTKISPERTKSVHKATPKSLLAVKRISISPVSPHVGDKVAINVLVANNGPKTVKNVKVAFYLGKKQVAWAVYDIKPRTAKNYRGFFTKREAPKAGSYTVSAMVDPDRALERGFYSCNSATLKITIAAPLVRVRRRTASPEKLTSRASSRHAFIRPAGQAVGKESPSGQLKMKTPKHFQARRVTPCSGKIMNVNVKVRTHAGPATTRSRRRQIDHDLRITWDRRGVLPARVDIFLYPIRRYHRGRYLHRNAVNNGRFSAIVKGVKKATAYIVRVQTHDGKTYADSRTFRLAPPVFLAAHKETPGKTAPKAGRNVKAITRKPVNHVKFDPHIPAPVRAAGSVAATPISIPRPIRSNGTAVHPALAPKSLAWPQAIKTGQNARPAAYKSGNHVKFDPGVAGPSRLPAGAAKAVAGKEIRPSNPMTTYGKGNPQVISPKKGDYLLNNQSYMVTCVIPTGKRIAINEISLVKIDGNVKKVVKTSKHTGQGGNDSVSVNFKIPPDAHQGNYLFHIEAKQINANNKWVTITVDSGVFWITGSAFYLEPIDNKIFVGEPLTIRWKFVNIPTGGYITFLWQSEVDGSIYRIGMKKPRLRKGESATEFTWKVGNTLSSTEIPLGPGRIIMASKFSKGQTNISHMAERPVQPLQLKITEPTNEDVWTEGSFHMVKWSINTSISKNRDIEIRLKNAHTDESLTSGSIKSVSWAQSLKMLVPDGIGSIPVYIQIKPRGRISDDASVVSQKFKIKGLADNSKMMPAGDTVFKITGVDYPKAGGKMTVHVQVNASKSFMFGRNGSRSETQELAFDFRNFVPVNTAAYAKSFVPVTVSDGKIRTGMYVRGVISPDVKTYDITFTPQLGNQLWVVKEIHQTVVGPPGNAKYKTNYYFPKLDIYLTSFTTGKTKHNFWQMYLRKTKGIPEHVVYD